MNLSQPGTYEDEKESQDQITDDSHDELDPEEEPTGTIALLTVYLIVIVGLWIAVYVTLIERS